MNYYRQVLKKYAVFSGRASREEFWSFSKWHSLVAFGCVVLDGFGGLGAFTVLYLLATLLPTVAVMVRRLHDVGQSGKSFWWVLVPFAGAIIMLIYLRDESQPGVNQYGPNPKETETKLVQ